MNWLKTQFVREGRALSGVICIESATYIHALSNFPPSPLLRFSEVQLSKTPNNIRFIYPDRTLPVTEDIELVANKLYVTNKERTICDMILYESNDEFIYDSIETYLGLHGTEETLREYAQKYRCQERTDYYLSTLSDYLAETW